MTENIRQTLDRLHALPPIPQIAHDILSLKMVSYEGDQELLQLIEKDPPISAKVVGLANSTLFGASKKIISVNDAAALVGIRRIKMTALSFAMMSAVARPSPAGLLNVHDLWQHSLAVTLWMHAISRYMPEDARPQDEEVFLAGLLHDIGFLVLDYLAPRLSDKFHATLAADPTRSVEELEAAMLEMSHCELGAELGQRWGLQESVIAVIRYHHQPDNPQAAIGQPLVKMVNLAEKLMPTFSVSRHAPADIAPEDWLALGIASDNVPKIIEMAQQHAHESGHMAV
jgi:putative nucleotidyltransferase with HDIG domain